MELWEMEFDESNIQPTMRKVVRWLRSEVYNTTDSGDGVINVAAGMEDALDRAHVHMVIGSPFNGVREAQRLYSEVSTGLCLPDDSYEIQYTYNPVDNTGILTLWDVTDADMPA